MKESKVLYITGAGSTNGFSWGIPNGSPASLSLEVSFPKVKKVEFHNNYATVVYFEDNTVVRSVTGEKDSFNPEMGYAMCLAKKYMGSYEKFAWSLEKAKHYENGKKVKKIKVK